MMTGQQSGGRKGPRYEFERAIRAAGGRLSRTEKLVAWTLASYSTGASGKDCHPGQKRLAADCGCSVKTVERALARLRELGMIARVVEGSKCGRRGWADEYQLTGTSDIQMSGDPAATSDTQMSGDPLGTPDIPGKNIRHSDVAPPVLPSEEHQGGTRARDLALLADGCPNGSPPHAFDNPPGKCWDCRDVRLLTAKVEEQRKRAARNLAEQRAKIIALCTDCRGSGTTENADGLAIKCEHPKLAEQLQALERANAGWRPAASKVPA